MARELVETQEFIEVYVNTPLAVAESRDPKGLYGKARRGELKNFTGVDSPYEAPEHAEVELDTTRMDPAEAVETILQRLKQMGIVRRRRAAVNRRHVVGSRGDSMILGWERTWKKRVYRTVFARTPMRCTRVCW